MISHLLKKIFIYFLIMLVVILNHIPMHYTLDILYPNLLFLIVFFFELSEGEKLSKIFLIFCGLLNDYLESSLIGLTSLQLIILSFLMSKNMKALEEQKFGITWAAFTVLIFIVYALKIIILSIFYKTSLFSVRLLLELCLTVTFYPPAHFALTKIFYFRRKYNAR
ncbi:rod shape-determining protein MreD [Holosporaceae bacterium 'Namur']|nr:rod shape-determining protein MreD [Holosporaceae bacterium 'Namur']